MKKWLISVSIIFLLTISAVYFLIPNYIRIHSNVSINAKRKGLYRLLTDENQWAKWWPGKIKNNTAHSQKVYTYKGFTYWVTEKMLSSIIVAIQYDKTSVESSLNILPEKEDTVVVGWECVVPTSYNPVARVRAYFKSRDLENDMQYILYKMGIFFSDPQHIYELNIQQVAVVDSTLISTFGVSQGYPSTAYIYDLVNQLKKYIASQSAVETGYPMLNLNTNDSVHYLTRVAIPVNKKLKDSDNISYKWMLGGGNILVAEVKGGPFAIKNAFDQMENYVNDYGRTAPAIPFQSLVTDRVKQPDSTKWITRIYYPVI